MSPKPIPSRLQALEAHVLEGIAQADRGEFADLTPEETERYLETGELPERVERCIDAYDSRRST